MAWTLAPSLKKLFAEINARWPNRDRTSDGSIGDAAHSARESQHNPNRDPSDSIPDGTVTAIDVDSTSIDANALIRAAIADSRTWYIIHNRTIWSSTYDFRARRYTGTNPHTGHVHISLRQSGAAARSTASWNIFTGSSGGGKTPGTTKPAPAPVVKTSLHPNVKPNRSHKQVAEIQRALIKAGYGPIRGSVSYFYGENTQAAVVRFHRANPQFASSRNDPVLGPKGWRHLQDEAARAK